MEQAARMRTAAERSKGFFLGLDLGQAADYTALVIIERVGHEPPDPMGALEDAAKPFRDDHRELDTFEVRHVERLPLRTPYPDVVRVITDLLKTEELNSVVDENGYPLWPTLAIDATGVGTAVVDMFRASLEYPTIVQLMPIVITGGHSMSRTDGGLGVPKHDLVGRAVAYLQKGQLKIGRAHEHSALIEAELRNFKMKQNISTGYVTYEAWRERDHDDLVLALCVAVFAAGFGTYSATGWATKLRR
jgi:hypothetical protein